MFLAQRTKRKRIIERDSHLAKKASGSSISNSCQAKTGCCIQLAWAATVRGGTKLHGSVAESRVRVFVVTTVPWEPYFMDSPRIIWSYSKVTEKVKIASFQYVDIKTMRFSQMWTEIQEIYSLVWSLFIRSLITSGGVSNETLVFIFSFNNGHMIEKPMTIEFSRDNLSSKQIHFLTLMSL